MMDAYKKDTCCYATMEGCGGFFSKWSAKSANQCLGPSVRRASRVRAHQDYDLLDPKQFFKTLETTAAPQFARVEPLGEGARSVVFLVRERNSGEVRALKMAQHHVAAAAFDAECSTAQAVHLRVAKSEDPSVVATGSRHLLRCFRADTAFSPALLELEYGGGAPWARLASNHSTQTLRLLKQLFLGLHAFEKSKPQTVHHDIKWENTAVSKDGCLKIIDFDAALAGLPNIIEDARRMPYTEGYSESGYVECGPRGGQCTLAYSFDAYSAGMMASASLCGAAEWRFYQKVLEEPAAANSQLRKALPEANQEAAVAMYLVGFRSILGRLDRMPMKALVEKMEKSPIPKPEEVSAEGRGAAANPASTRGGLAKLAATLLHEGFARKLEFCESLLGTDDGRQGLEILDRLRSEEAGRRPRPSEVLASSLFRGAATGCDSDSV